MDKRTILLTVIPVFLTLLPFNARSNFGSGERPGADTTRKIEIRGLITHKRDDLNGATVKLFEKDRLLLNKNLGNDNHFKLSLPVEKMYTVEISNTSFHPKVFRLATFMWESEEDIYPVEMFVDLFASEELEKMKKPERFTQVTTLYYNPRLGNFENNEPRNFILEEKFKLLKQKLKRKNRAVEKNKKSQMNNKQMKLLKSRPDRLSKYNS